MRTSNLLVGVGFAAAAAFMIQGGLQDADPDATPSAPEGASHEVALPVPGSLAFEPNLGQSDEGVRFLARGDGYALFLTPGEAVIRLGQPDRSDRDDRVRVPANPASPASVVRLSLAGANPDPGMTGEHPLERRSHYFIGNDPARWQRNVPSYGKVRYEAVYPGIDLVYYGNEGQLEYDFVVAPGADPGLIALDFAGVDDMRLDDGGNLLLAVGGGEVVQRKPVIYQQVSGVRRLVEGAYALLGDARIGFSLGNFDASLPLVIDPVLSYSSYLGGDSDDLAQALAVDRAGNTWVTGITYSTEFPWANALDSEISGFSDAYVCRFTAAGGIPMCAYIGGDALDEGFAVAPAPDGGVFVAGYTQSYDFPTLNAAQSVSGDVGGNCWCGDAFVLRINAAADGLDFSTYLGGADVDMARALAVDQQGFVYVTGDTDNVLGDSGSAGFPVTGGTFMANDPPGLDAFVAKYAANGAQQFSTLLGGNGDDGARGLAIARNGAIHVSGFTTSTDFPTKAAFQATPGGSDDAFIAVLNPTANSLVYGTYLGGSGRDLGYGLQLDSAQNMYIVGNTTSPDFPTVDALQGSNAGDQDAFLAQVSANGSTMMFGTYLGGSDADDLRHIVLDPAGNAILAGYTSSSDFPLSGSFQPSTALNSVVMKISGDTRQMLWSTALGGDEQEWLTGLGIDLDGTIHVAGRTWSDDFPVAAAVQAQLANPPEEGSDTFLTRISELALGSWHGDFNGDGTDDILWRNNATGQGSIWYSGNAATATNITRVINLDWRIAGVGDFNGDGKSDLLWRNAMTGANTIWRSGNSATTQATTAVTNRNWQVHGVGDFNADGSDDIVWHNTATGQTGIWHSANAKTVSTPTILRNLAWDIVGAGDFDGDGVDDLLWRNTSTGQNSIWRSANSKAPLAVGGIAGHQWQVVGIADFQGDGRDDILWRNMGDGRNVIWRNGSSAQGQAVTGVRQQAWRIVGTGDYTGDGKADLLWRDSATGSNVVWRSATATTPKAVTGVRDPAWTPKS